MSPAETRPGVKRRAVLGLVVAGVGSGCLRRLPRATGPRGPPDAPAAQPRESFGGLEITNWDYGEANDGRLRVFGSIENTGSVESTATVLVNVSVEGEEYSRTTDVSVPAGETSSFDMVLDPTYDAFVRRGSISVELV